MRENKGKCFQVGVWFLTEFQHEFLLWVISFQNCTIILIFFPRQMDCYFLLFRKTDESATWDHHVATVHCGLTILSSIANGAHEFTVIVCSRCTEFVIHCQPLSRPLKLPDKEGGVRWEWLHTDLRQVNLWENIHCNGETPARKLHHLRDEEDHTEGTHPTNLSCFWVLQWSSYMLYRLMYTFT